MTQREYDDETLMAFADGELDAAMATDLEQAMTEDPGLASRVALFRQTRTLAKSALDPVLAEPVPDHLAAAVGAMLARDDDSDQRNDDNVVALPHRTSRPSARHWLTAMAASLALVVGGVAGYVLGTAPKDGGDGRFADLDQPGLVQALNTVPSGAETVLDKSGDRFRAIASFHGAGGVLCREFEVDRRDRSTLVSVACRAGRSWGLRFAVTASGGDDGYAPASSLEALDAYLKAVGAGEPMTAADESAALAVVE